MTTRAPFPAWLEWSGLPLEINQKIRVGAWSVFKKVVEIDCERNRTPDAIEITLTDLSIRCGLTPDVCRRILEGLRKRRHLLVFLPDSEEESMLLQVRTPLPTPMSLDDLAKAHPELELITPKGNARYAVAEEEVDPEDPAIQRTVDLYLDAFGTRMNSFILDDLIFIARRFRRREIEAVFHQAKKAGLKSLGWIARELSRRHANRDKKPKT